MDTHHPSQTQSAATIQAGQEALARGAWEEARACFEAALKGEETPEALESLGMAAWWLDDATTIFDVRNHTYRLYRERGDRASGRRSAPLADVARTLGLNLAIEAVQAAG